MLYDAAAYHGQPVPTDLVGEQRTQYIMLRQVYSAFRSKRISQEEGALTKDFVYRYPSLREREKISLLQDIFSLLCEAAAKGDAQALEDSQYLAGVHCCLTGNRPVKPDLTGVI